MNVLIRKFMSLSYAYRKERTALEASHGTGRETYRVSQDFNTLDTSVCH